MGEPVGVGTHAVNPGPLAAIIGAIIRWWRTRPGTGRHSRQPRHNKRKGRNVSDDDDESTTTLYGDPLGVTPTRREVRGAEPDHPALPDHPAGPLAADVARRLAHLRYADWRYSHAE